MTDLKFKLAHKLQGKKKWKVAAKTQHQHLIGFLQDMITQLQQEPIPLAVNAGDQLYEGHAIPIMATFHQGRHDEFEIVLNDKNLGLIRRLKSGWKMNTVSDKKLIREIGKLLEEQ